MHAAIGMSQACHDFTYRPLAPRLMFSIVVEGSSGASQSLFHIESGHGIKFPFTLTEAEAEAIEFDGKRVGRSPEDRCDVI